MQDEQLPADTAAPPDAERTDQQAADHRAGVDQAEPALIPKRVIGRPFPKGRSPNPAGRPRTTSDALFVALVEAADALRRDKWQTDAEKLDATMGLLRGALGLCRRMLREARRAPAESVSPAPRPPSAELETFAAKYLGRRPDEESKP